MHQQRLLPLTALLVFLAPPSLGQVSELWGHAGEEWDPTGRLPDYSYAGYHAGESPLPQIPVVTNVRDFGAVADGVTNNAQAFRNAISYAASVGGGAVLVPRGTYSINEIIYIEDDNVVLRGEGSGSNGTVLYFPKHLRQLTGKSTPWIHGEGGLLWIGDRDNFWNPGIGTKITGVNTPQLRGDRELVLNNTSQIQVGGHYLLRMTDPDRSLGSHIHNDQAAPGNCSWQPQPIYWPFEVVAKNGSVLTLRQPLRLDVRTKWKPEVWSYQPVREVGIEHMMLRCAPHSYPGHLNENGYNPITFEGALNCWMKDVTVENADNGPGLVGANKNITITGLNVIGTVNGHHGVSIRNGAADCLVEDFYLEPIFIHGFTVDHSPAGNVVRDGFGVDVYLDHHRDGSYENLFSDIDVGGGAFVWSSGGSTCAGPHAAARNTYWNLRGNAWSAPPAPVWADIQSNVVPAQFTQMTPNNAWLEDLPDLTVQDIYESQLERRLREEILSTAKHTVATFEDGTLGTLAQVEGDPYAFGQGTLQVQGTEIHQFVDPHRTYDDQEFLVHVGPGLARLGKVGAVIRKATPGAAHWKSTRIFLEGTGGTGSKANNAVVKILDVNGFSRTSAPININPFNEDLTLRVEVLGTRVRAFVNSVLMLDVTGISRPAGGGYTSLYAKRDDSNRWGNLDVKHAHVLTPGQKAELHVDANGTLWVTLAEYGLLTGALDTGDFHFFIDDQLQLDYDEFVQWVLGNFLSQVDSYSLDHLTFGLQIPALEGTRYGLLYGAVDEAIVPWW